MTNQASLDLLNLTARLRAHIDDADYLVDLEDPAVSGFESFLLPNQRRRVGHLVSLSSVPTQLPDLITVPDEDYESALVASLHAAVRIEFATIPLYLTALWSIIDQTHLAAITIRAVVHEEMLHLSLLCNLLSALGQRPVLTGDNVPTFPGTLPGDVHKDIELNLLGYGPEALDLFMHIERPYKPTEIEDEDPEQFDTSDRTIGQFYETMITSLAKKGDELDLNPKWQIAGPFSWLVITDLRDVEDALLLIMEQGEGAPGGIPYSRSPRYLSHYYRFKSLALQRKLTWDASKNKLVKGDPITAPPVFTLAPAPEGEYGLAAPSALRRANDKFETTYSQMLRFLEGSWLEGGHKSYLKAIELMFDLCQLAQTMMHIGTPDGRGYCPTFRYRP
jgi:hypothetical protein